MYSIASSSIYTYGDTSCSLEVAVHTVADSSVLESTRTDVTAIAEIHVYTGGEFGVLPCH